MLIRKEDNTTTSNLGIVNVIGIYRHFCSIFLYNFKDQFLIYIL